MRAKMRGKKTNFDFISSFIKECVLLNRQSPQEFVLEAKLRISNIDAKIKESINLKKERANLTEVISHFNDFINKSDDSLKYYDLDHNFCKTLCDKLKVSSINVSSYKDHPMIDKMIKLKIVSIYNGNLIQSCNFRDYLKIVFGEK